MPFNFSGKKVLVTGASRGIGRGIALTLAQNGCKVYALASTKETLDTLAEENSNIFPIVQDLSNWDETRVTLDKLEVLDGLVNNAAVLLEATPALEHSKQTLEHYMSVNLFAVVNCIQSIGKKMMDEGKKGSIVNVSSHLGIRAYSSLLGYDVSKAGVDMVTKQLALELGQHGVRVNSVNSALVETDLIKTIDKSGHVREILIERTPMMRNLTVEDVVGPVLYLLSDVSSMVTGTVNLVDGGLACNITTKQ